MDTFHFKIVAVKRKTMNICEGPLQKDSNWGLLEIRAETQRDAHRQARVRALKVFRDYEKVTVRQWGGRL